jgi:hypothetical protein
MEKIITIMEEGVMEVGDTMEVEEAIIRDMTMAMTTDIPMDMRTNIQMETMEDMMTQMVIVEGTIMVAITATGQCKGVEVTWKNAFSLNSFTSFA